MVRDLRSETVRSGVGGNSSSDSGNSRKSHLVLGKPTNSVQITGNSFLTMGYHPVEISKK